MPQVMPHAIPQTHAAFYPHRRANQFGTAVLIWCGKHRLVRQGLPHNAALERQLIHTPLLSCAEPNA